MIQETVIREAAHLLRRAAPDARIVVFGSHARGNAGPESDVDFLVVEPHVTSRREESVRLRDVLRPLRIPVDIVVVSAAAFAKWSEIPGTVFHEAAKEGVELDGIG